MADPVRSDAAVEQPAERTGATPAAPRPHSRLQAAEAALRRRFGLAYLALAVAMGVAAGLFVVFVDRTSSSQGTAAASGAWPSWRPERSGELGAIEVARWVGQRYRLPSGRQLVAVIAQRPQFQNVQVNNDLIRPSDAQYPKDIAVLPLGNGIMYVLCGLGQACAIDEGEPTAQSRLLLRREAIELAMLTFNYDADVETVTAVLPPEKSDRFALVFRRQDLRDELRRGLSRTFSQRGPLRPGDIGQKEAATIDNIALPSFYAYAVQAGGDGTPIFILDPFRGP